jgi:hypothetical protein
MLEPINFEQCLDALKSHAQVKIGAHKGVITGVTMVNFITETSEPLDFNVTLFTGDLVVSTRFFVNMPVGVHCTSVPHVG